MRTCWPVSATCTPTACSPVEGGVVRAGADARARSPSSSAAAPGTIRRSAVSSERVSPTVPWSATSSPRRPPRRRTRSARAASNGAGLLFSTGNYAGDVMNFTLAQQRLCDEGIDTRVVFVTDDIASAPVEEINKRRGIAGDFVVFKIAGAAAEAGYDLDGVERVARLANDRTRTLGVAFAGCTMPGADTRCSTCRTVRWVSAWASTVSPGSPRRTCPVPPTWRNAWSTECWPRRPARHHPGRGDPQRARRHQVRGAVRGVADGRTDCCATPATPWWTPRSVNWSPASTWRAVR